MAEAEREAASAAEKTLPVLVLEMKTNRDQGQQGNGAATAQREIVNVTPIEPNPATDKQLRSLGTLPW